MEGLIFGILRYNNLLCMKIDGKKRCKKGGNKQELDPRTRLTPNLECTNEYMHYVNYSRLPNSRTPELPNSNLLGKSNSVQIK